MGPVLVLTPERRPLFLMRAELLTEGPRLEQDAIVHSLPLATVSLRAPSTALVLLIHNRSDIFCRAHLMHAL